VFHPICPAAGDAGLVAVVQLGGVDADTLADWVIAVAKHCLSSNQFDLTLC
jgi:hypothetical protein